MVRWLAPACATLALLCPAAPSNAIAAPDSAESAAEKRPIEAYTPRLMVRERDEICDIDGEQYKATTVDTVLGNPAVELTEADRDGDETTLKKGLTADPGPNLQAEAEGAPAKRWRERLARRAAPAEA